MLSEAEAGMKCEESRSPALLVSSIFVRRSSCFRAYEPSGPSAFCKTENLKYLFNFLYTARDKKSRLVMFGEGEIILFQKPQRGKTKSVGERL